MDEHGAELKDLVLPSDWPQMVWLPLRGMPKKRPTVTRNGTFMDHKYVDWKAEMELELSRRGLTGTNIDVPVHLYVSFRSGEIGLQLKPIPAALRPKHMRLADLDNLVGGVMDALQEADVISNDRLVYEISARVH